MTGLNRPLNLILRPMQPPNTNLRRRKRRNFSGGFISFCCQLRRCSDIYEISRTRLHLTTSLEAIIAYDKLHQESITLNTLKPLATGRRNTIKRKYFSYRTIIKSGRFCLGHYSYFLFCWTKCYVPCNY